MIAYKFLNPGGVGPYSGFSWPLPASESPSAWVEIRGALQLCRNGIHACRADQLPYWWGAQLWEIELTEPIADAGRVVLAARARLVRRVRAWDESTMRRYARACAWRVRDRGIGWLRASDLDEAADALARCTELDSLAVAAATLVDTAPGDLIIGYLADAASFSIGSMALVKTVPYVAAHVAGCTAGPQGGVEYDDRYCAEREWQAAWLAEQLGLHTSTAVMPPSW